MDKVGDELERDSDDDEYQKGVDLRKTKIAANVLQDGFNKLISKDQCIEIFKDVRKDKK